MKDASLEYKGKSKDVYALPNGNVLLVFGDGFTGTDGKEDPGGNTNIGTKAGLGRKNLEVSAFLYDLIQKNLGIPTQNVAVDLQNCMLEARRAKTLGKGMTFQVGGKNFVGEGLEFISRNKAWGSFLKRNPEVKQGEPMTEKNGLPFVEVSVKSDEANDPFFTREQFIASGCVSGEDFDQAVLYTKQITKYLTELFAKGDMELVDMKMEFGKDNKGNLILTDEISAGSLRALSQGESVSKDEIHKRIMELENKKRRLKNETTSHSSHGKRQRPGRNVGGD